MDYKHLTIPMGYQLGPNGEKLPLTKEQQGISDEFCEKMKHVLSRTHDEDEVGELEWLGHNAFDDFRPNLKDNTPPTKHILPKVALDYLCKK